MKLLFILVSITCLLSLVCGSFLKDWTRIKPAQGSERITFFVALKQRNLDKLDTLLYAVSDPVSPHYGREVPQEEIAELVYPPKDEHDLVFNYLKNNGPSMEIISYGDSLKVTASVDNVASIFKANFHWFHHGPSGHEVIRAPEITIPDQIAQAVYMVTNLVMFPIIIKKDKVNLASDISAIEDTDYGYFAPSTIRRIYNIPAGTEATNEQSSQCALEFTPEGAFYYSDLELFCQLADETFFNYTEIVGPFAPGAWGDTESELDVEVLATIGSGAQNWFWTISDGWIYEMAVEIYNAQTKPWVFSISYGWPEVMTCGGTVVQSDCDGIDNQIYISRANAELAKLGTARISVIACSQDEGAPSVANIGCTNTTHPIFGIYPGSSPYVTSVSGTTAVNSTDFNESVDGNSYPPICYDYPCSNSSVEYTCMPNNTAFRWTTGGGFSEFTPSPSYQLDAITNYFSGDIPKPPTQFTWPDNRGYPDIAAIGARVLIVVGGAASVVEGTSASTPIIAGITTLLNDYRFNSGKTALGFLNPLLYNMSVAAPTAFQDIVVGSNECSEGDSCCGYGYNAGPGWDPVSGLGTPNFANMLAYVKTLP